MSTFKKREKIILVVVLGVAGVFFIQKLIITRLYAKIKDQRREIRLAEARLKKNIAIQKVKDEVSTDYERYGLYLTMSTDNEKQIVAELLKEIESIVHSSQGSIVTLSPQAEWEKEKTYKNFKVNFRIEVTFPQLLQFFGAVEDSKRLIRLEKLTIASKSEKNSLLNVDGTISLAVPL